MRPIDADALIAWIKESQQMTSKMKAVICKIKTMPSADRPKGEWIELHNPNLGMCMEHLIQCSVCGRCMCGRYQPYRSFCPNCGADMRGDDNE